MWIGNLDLYKERKSIRKGISKGKAYKKKKIKTTSIDSERTLHTIKFTFTIFVDKTSGQLRN